LKKNKAPIPRIKNKALTTLLLLKNPLKRSSSITGAIRMGAIKNLTKKVPVLSNRDLL
jgi:hypothetical protein